jgi:hypothetical protein
MRHLIRSFLDARDRTDLDPLIVAEGGAHSASKAELQPPRYTVFLVNPTIRRPTCPVLTVQPKIVKVRQIDVAEP